MGKGKLERIIDIGAFWLKVTGNTMRILQVNLGKGRTATNECEIQIDKRDFDRLCIQE